ncbi:hypothetical protein GB937_007423 [Aspergillus fischeri]|nr:hypothetical protein GB937_007423 [Aspergillus fischeri]
MLAGWLTSIKALVNCPVATMTSSVYATTSTVTEMLTMTIPYLPLAALVILYDADLVIITHGLLQKTAPLDGCACHVVAPVSWKLDRHKRLPLNPLHLLNSPSVPLLILNHPRISIQPRILPPRDDRKIQRRNNRNTHLDIRSRQPRTTQKRPFLRGRRQLVLEEAEMGAEFLIQELGADFAGDEAGDGFDEEGDGGVFDCYCSCISQGHDGMRRGNTIHDELHLDRRHETSLCVVHKVPIAHPGVCFAAYLALAPGFIALWNEVGVRSTEMVEEVLDDGGRLDKDHGGGIRWLDRDDG